MKLRLQSGILPDEIKSLDEKPPLILVLIVRFPHIWYWLASCCSSHLDFVPSLGGCFPSTSSMYLGRLQLLFNVGYYQMAYSYMSTDVYVGMYVGTGRGHSLEYIPWI